MEVCTQLNAILESVRLSVFVDTSITLSPVTRADAGVYQCIANNVVGSAYATSVLTVTAPRRRYTRSTLESLTSATKPLPQLSCTLSS